MPEVVMNGDGALHCPSGSNAGDVVISMIFVTDKWSSFDFAGLIVEGNTYQAKRSLA